MTQLLAFHGDSAIKEKYENRIKAHVAADNLLQQYGYWADGKGCAVGCTLEKNTSAQWNIHQLYEEELGIPHILARLEDRIFENSSKEWARQWPQRFLTAIPVGADLSNVWKQFMHWLLVDEQHGVIKYAQTDRVKAAINAVAAAFERNDVKRDEWIELRREAWAARTEAWQTYAAAAADAAAAAAADAAAAAAAADDADAAAAAAADAAAAAADAAAAAAAAAADAAAAAAADAADAADARRLARHQAWLKARTDSTERQGEKLLELMAAAPIGQKESA